MILRTLAIIVGLPFLAAWIAVQIAPDGYRAYAAIVAYLLGTFIGISIATEYAAGKIRDLADFIAAIKFGSRAFAWWAAILLSLIGIAWLSAALA